MKIPNKVKIGSHTYEVKYHNGPMTDLAGRCDGELNLIHLNKRFIKSKQESILLHEVIHTLNWMHDLSLNEGQVSSLGEGIHQFLTDNNLLK